MKKWQANLMLLGIAMIWGGGFLFTDQALLYIKPLHMQVLRFGIASLLLTLIFFKQIKETNRKAISVGLVLGLLFFIAMSLQTFGLQYTTIAKNAFLTVTNVIFVPIIIYMISKVPIKPFLFKGLILMIIGFFFLVFEIDIFDLTTSINNLDSQSKINTGDLLTLLGALFFALQYIVTERYAIKHSIIIVLIFQLYGATILSLISSLIFEGSFNYSYSTLLSSMPAILYLAIPSSIVAFGGLIIAQRYVSASNTAIICSLESMFAAIFSIMFGQPLTSSLVIGALLITLGIIWAQTGFQFNTSNHDLIIEEEVKNKLQ